MLKQRIAMRQMSPGDCKDPNTGFLAIERGADVDMHALAAEELCFSHGKLAFKT